MKKSIKEINLSDLKLQMIIGFIVLLFVIVASFGFMTNVITNSCSNYPTDSSLNSLVPFPIKSLFKNTQPMVEFCNNNLPDMQDNCGITTDKSDDSLIYSRCAQCDLRKNQCVKTQGLKCRPNLQPECVIIGSDIYHIIYSYDSFCDSNFICRSPPLSERRILLQQNCESPLADGGCYIVDCIPSTGCLLTYVEENDGKPCIYDGKKGICTRDNGCDTDPEPDPEPIIDLN